MGWLAFVAVGVGAAFGAWARWGLGLWLNAGSVGFPLGTLMANLLGGYLVGVAVGVFSAMPQLPAELRLVLITGFLGGLTTFSSFSAEVVDLLQRASYAWALAAVACHLGGSLVLTVLGLATVRWLHG